MIKRLLLGSVLALTPALAHADACAAPDVPTSAGYACRRWTTDQFTLSQTVARSLDGNLLENYVYVPAAPKLVGGERRLLVFLPGTGGELGSYRDFMAEAATRGYYVIGLTYRNDLRSLDLCGTWPACADDLYEQNVMGDYHDFYPNSDPGYNSLNYRFGSFVNQLDDDDVGGIDWGQFWSSDAAYTTNRGFSFNGEPAWSKIVIAGHAQGGEMATWITKNKPVIAGLAFEAPYATLDNKHEDGSPFHATFNTVTNHWDNDTTAWTRWNPSPTASTVEDTTFANYLDASMWPVGRIDRLFITLDVDDVGYDAPPKQGWMASAALFALGKYETFLSSLPSVLTPTECSGHTATAVDGCGPWWLRAYWDLMLDRAMTL